MAYYNQNVQTKRVDRLINNEKCIMEDYPILKHEFAELKQYVSELEGNTISVDASTRNRDLLLCGVNEYTNEQTNILALRVLGTVNPELDLSDIALAYRVGRAIRGKRNILVKFATERKRQTTYCLCGTLAHNPKTKNVSLNAGLPQILNDREADLRAVQKQAESQKRNVGKIEGSKVTIDGITYSYKNRDLLTYSYKNRDLLPVGCRLADAKTKDVNGGIAFQSQHTFLSNFFLCVITIDGRRFQSTEHAFQYARANQLGCPCRDCHPNSKTAKDVKEAKRLGSLLADMARSSRTWLNRKSVEER